MYERLKFVVRQFGLKNRGDFDRRSETLLIFGPFDFDGAEAVGNYGPAYERLSRIKGEYDPMNLFRLNQNIRPNSP